VSKRGKEKRDFDQWEKSLQNTQAQEVERGARALKGFVKSKKSTGSHLQPKRRGWCEKVSGLGSPEKGGKIPPMTVENMSSGEKKKLRRKNASPVLRKGRAQLGPLSVDEEKKVPLPRG